MSSGILCLLRLQQARGPRRLDAHEHHDEVLRVAGGPGIPSSWATLRLLLRCINSIGWPRPSWPSGERGPATQLTLLLVADEVIVHDEDVRHAERGGIASTSARTWGHGLGSRPAAVASMMMSQNGSSLRTARPESWIARLRYRSVFEKLEPRPGGVEQARLLLLPVLRLPAPRPRSLVRTKARCTPASPTKRTSDLALQFFGTECGVRATDRHGVCRGAGRPRSARTSAACGSQKTVIPTRSASVSKSIGSTFSSQSTTSWDGGVRAATGREREVGEDAALAKARKDAVKGPERLWFRIGCDQVELHDSRESWRGDKPRSRSEVRAMTLGKSIDPFR